MLIGYAMPQSTVTLSGTASWLTADGGAACIDRKPGRRARLQWRTDGAPALAHAVPITVAFTGVQPIRVAAVLGLRNVPVGAQIAINGKRAGDASYTYNFTGGNTATVAQFADGTRGAWFILPAAAEAVLGVEFSLYNNAAGATWATAATVIDIGELVAMPAVDVEIDREWIDEVADPSESLLSRAAQLVTVGRQAYRRLEATLTPDAAARVRAGGLANGMDWTRLRAELLGDRRAVAIPRWKNAAGAVDLAEVNRTALYGVGRIGALSHAGGDQFTAGITFQEVPAIP